MSGNLRFLTAETFSCPTTRILSDAGPSKLGAHGLTGAFNAGMTKSVDNVEDAASEGEWNEWPKWTIADVYNQLGSSNVDGLEVEAASDILSKSTEIWVERLLSGNLFPVDAEVPNCSNDAVEVGESCVRLSCLFGCGNGSSDGKIGFWVRMPTRRQPWNGWSCRGSANGFGLGMRRAIIPLLV